MEKRTRERRRVPRYRFDSAIKVNGQTALAIDLSVRSVFFETARPLDVGQAVDLVLPYEHAEPWGSMACTATIVRVERRGQFYGVAAMYEPLAFTIPA